MKQVEQAWQIKMKNGMSLIRDACREAGEVPECKFCCAFYQHCHDEPWNWVIKDE